MRLLLVFVFSFFLSVPAWAVEPEQPHPTIDIYIVRAAEQLQSPHIVNYRMVEWTQMRGRWILPDVGYYDTGYGKNQIWFTGAGAELVHRRNFVWSQEVYVTQEAGPEARNRRSIWLWPVLDAQFSRRLSGEVVLYPTLPLNKAQRWGFDVDRAKLEWAATPHWLVGAGYSAGIDSNRSWASMPFLTATRRTRAGDFEVWLQSISGGAQAQLRYTLERTEH